MGLPFVLALLGQRMNFHSKHGKRYRLCSRFVDALRGWCMLCQFLLALPQQFRPQMVRRDSTNQGMENFEPTGHCLKCRRANGKGISPSLLLFIRVSEKENFQVSFEAETECSFYAVKTFILLKTACGRLCRGRGVDSVTRFRDVFDSNCFS